MKTDSFFYQLLKQLPQTFFEMLGLPGERAHDYEFDSVELKNSLRIDGIYRPKKPLLPIYFLEVQFQKRNDFYANLFAKVFVYFNQNKKTHDWSAAAIFASRSLEPKHLLPFEDLLASKRVTRIYLDEYEPPSDPPLGLGIIQLVKAPEHQLEGLVERLFEKAKDPATGSETGKIAIDLIEDFITVPLKVQSRKGVTSSHHMSREDYGRKPRKTRGF